MFARLNSSHKVDRSSSVLLLSVVYLETHLCLCGGTDKEINTAKIEIIYVSNPRGEGWLVKREAGFKPKVGVTSLIFG